MSPGCSSLPTRPKFRVAEDAEKIPLSTEATVVLPAERVADFTPVGNPTDVCPTNALVEFEYPTIAGMFAGRNVDGRSGDALEAGTVKPTVASAASATPAKPCCKGLVDL